MHLRILQGFHLHVVVPSDASYTRNIVEKIKDEGEVKSLAGYGARTTD
jgi:hypothetical protein